MTDNSDANTINDVFRSLGAAINRIIYFLLGIMYQIFFNVSSAQLFESETIKNFYGRVQLIIGVFMVFKLAISILQGIMDPEKFTNPKDGFGSVITRVIISLALLTVLVPINVPDAANANSFEKYINNNGLLFGTLYSLQDRILSNNTLGRLILGTTDSATTVSDSEAQDGLTEADKQNEKLEKSSRIFTATILKSFLRINLLPSDARKDDKETNQQNWYCGDDLSSDAEQAINTYKQLDVDPSTLLSSSLVTMDCDIGDSWGEKAGNLVTKLPVVGGFFGIFVGNEGYVFAFEWVGSLIIGAIFLFILVGFTVDIAVRSIKLAILRLLAPIPVISYIEPKSSQDGGMFSSWVKALTSTYLDLFLRLAIVYFAIFLIQDMIANGVVINEATGMVGIMSFIFIMLGLLVFARMAPKFIKDILGIKAGSMTNFGLGGMAAFAGAVRQGGSFHEGLEAVSDTTRAQQDAYKQGKAQPEIGEMWNSGRDYAAKILTGDQNMTGRRMSRGTRHLNRMGITTPIAEDLKQDMYDAQDQQRVYDNLQQRATASGWRGLSSGEQNKITEGYKKYIDNWNANHDSKHQKAFDQYELERDGASLASAWASSEAGKAKSKYEDVSGMQKVYGQARSYEAQYEGENYKYSARNLTNRALGGLGRNYETSRMQQFRTQKFPDQKNQSATRSESWTGLTTDNTPPGSTSPGDNGDDS